MDQYSQRQCDDRHKTIYNDRMIDRAWTETLEGKIDKLNTVIISTLAVSVTDLLAIVIVYILLR